MHVSIAEPSLINDGRLMISVHLYAPSTPFTILPLTSINLAIGPLILANAIKFTVLKFSCILVSIWIEFISKAHFLALIVIAEVELAVDQLLRTGTHLQTIPHAPNEDISIFHISRAKAFAMATQVAVAGPNRERHPCEDHDLSEDMADFRSGEACWKQVYAFQ